MTRRTVDHLSRACLACVAAACVFAVVEDIGAAMACCAFAAGFGMAACYGDEEISPWQ